ncbi:TPA: hypothetical protein ACXJF2_000861 [Serratia marcescens]
MTNKLSELSKPVAWKLHHHDRYYFEENADVVAIAESMGQAKGDAVYSQEYVSALQHESAVNWEAAASLNVENQELKKRIAELEEEFAFIMGQNDGMEKELREKDARIEHLEAKLATPVRLPRPACTYADHSHPAYSRKQVEEIITSSGMRFTVEGDE